jgi:cell division protein FtsQ
LFQDSAYAKTKTLQDLLQLALFLEKNPIWAAQIEQVYVDNYSEFLLIPRVGNHSIVLGTCEELEEKMEKLRLFYAKALPSIGWDTYGKINLSYRGQVVATRRNAAEPNTEQNATHTNEQNTGH